MIKLNWLEEIITYTIYSPFVKGESPVSLLIISDVESGKTKMLEKFKDSPSVLYMSDFTRYGLYHDYFPGIKSGEYRTIIVPDIVALTYGKGAHATEGVISFLNSVTEEGLSAISTFNISVSFDKPIMLGFIGAIPSGVFRDQRSSWHKMGFISRTLPISYSVSKQTVEEILEYIMKKEHANEPTKIVSRPDKDIAIKLDSKLARELLPMTQKIAGAIGTYGFRLQRHLQVLAEARALSLGRDTVTTDDIQRIKELAAWINLDFKPI